MSGIVVVLPSLKISGGVREALRLASELSGIGHTVTALSLWKSPHSMHCSLPLEYLSSWSPRVARAISELPFLALRFVFWWRHASKSMSFVLFTHYTTLPLALLIPKSRRLFFAQDLEWKFIKSRVISSLLRQIVLRVYNSGRVISANAYLSQCLSDEGIDVALDAPIWADPEFLTHGQQIQNIDFAMVLRKGDCKRLDLYLRFISLCREHGARCAVITPEDDIALQVTENVSEVLLRPDIFEMRDLYARSACFIHLSEHEGFGLPPLEAMGAGCIPICRDSGGVRAFMLNGPVDDLLLPLSMTLEDLFDHALQVLKDPALNERRAAVRKHFQLGLDFCELARKNLLSFS